MRFLSHRAGRGAVTRELHQGGNRARHDPSMDCTCGLGLAADFFVPSVLIWNEKVLPVLERHRQGAPSVL